MESTIHTKSCLADAMISAVENLRDDESIDAVDFADRVKGGEILDLAKEYLDTDLQTCKCHVKAIDHVKRVYAESGTAHAQSLAESYLKCGYFGFSDYMHLVKWTEGRA